MYEVPKSRASINQNRFDFRFAGDPKKYSIPLLKFIRPSLALTFEHLTETESIVALFEEYFPGQDMFAKFEDSEQFEGFMNAWKEASGIDVGESEGLSES
jgi:hypothetical protein